MAAFFTGRCLAYKLLEFVSRIEGTPRADGIVA
jgi:hypothetical protein